MSDLGLREAGVEGLSERAATGWGTGGEATGLGLTFFLPGLGEAGAAARGAGAVEGAIAADAALQGTNALRATTQTALQAALAPTAAVTQMGVTAENVARKALAEIIERESLQKLGGTAARGAVEGTLYGAGQGISEEALGNPDMNAESLLAAMGSGALLGAGLGAGAGTALHGTVLGAAGATKYAGEKIGTAAGKLGDLAGEAAGKAKASIADQLGWVQTTPTGERVMMSVEQIADQMKAMGYDTITAENPILKKAVEFFTETFPTKVGRYDLNDIRTINTPKGQAFMREGRAGLEETGRDLGDVVNKISEAHSQAGREVYGVGGLREQALDAKIPKGNAPGTLKAVANNIDQIDLALQHIPQNSEHYGLGHGGGNGVVKPYRDALDTAVDKIFREAGVDREYKVTKDVFTGDGVEQVTEIRKRTLQELAEQFPISDKVVRRAYDELNSVKQLFRDPARFDEAIPQVGRGRLRDQFQTVYAKSREGLEDPAIWGEAGHLQKSWNEAYAARARAYEDLKKARIIDADGAADLNGINTYLNRVDRLAGDKTAAALDQWQAANEKYATTAKELFGGHPEVLQRAEAFNQEFAKLRTQLSEKVAVFNAVKKLTERYNKTFGSFGTGAGAALLFGGIGSMFGLPGAVAGAAGAMMLNPARMAIVRANAAGMLQDLRAYLGSRASGLFSEETAQKARTAAAKVAETAGPTARKVRDSITRPLRGAYEAITAGNAPRAGTIRRFISPATQRMLDGKTAEARQAAYRERLAEIQSMQDPVAFAQHSTRELGEVHDAMPTHAAAMTARAQSALGMLAAMLPPIKRGTLPNDPFAALYADPQVDDRDLRKFAQADRIAQDPLSIYDRLDEGYVFQHEIDTLNQMYPGLAEQIRLSVLEGLGGKKRPSGHRAVAMGRLLGQPRMKIAKAQSVYKSVNSGRTQFAPSGAGSSAAKPRITQSASYRSTTDNLDNYLTN